MLIEKHIPPHFQKKMSIVYDQSIDSSKKAFVHGDHKWTSVYPLNGSQVININAVSQEQLFELPTADRLVNLSKSYLEFTLNVPATAALFTNLHALGCPLVAGLRLHTRRNLGLADSNHVGMYSKAMAVYANDDGMARERGNGVTGLNTGRFVYSDLTPLQISTRQLAIDPTDKRPDFLGAAGDPVEPAIIKSMLSSPVVNSAISVKVSYRLGDIIPLSLLDVDRELYFGEPLQLTVRYQELSKLGFLSTLDSNYGPGFAALPAGITLDNIRIRTAVNMNATLFNQYSAKLQSPEGYEMLIPYVVDDLRTLGAATNHSIQNRLTRAMGMNCMFVMTVVGPSAVSPITVHSMSNINSASGAIGQAFTEVYDTLGTERLSDGNYRADDLTLYRHVKSQSDGSLALQSPRSFNDFTAMIRSWAGRPLHELAFGNAATEETGLSLTNDQIYTVNYSTAGAAGVSVYTFAVVQRALKISASSGITLA